MDSTRVEEHQGGSKRIQKGILPKEPTSSSKYPCIHKNNLLRFEEESALRLQVPTSRLSELNDCVTT